MTHSREASPIFEFVTDADAELQVNKEVAMNPWNGVSRLLLPVREAAAALSICQKTRWSITRPRGDLSCVRIGRRVLYAVDELRRWITAQEKGGAA